MVFEDGRCLFYDFECREGRDLKLEQSLENDYKEIMIKAAEGAAVYAQVVKTKRSAPPRKERRESEEIESTPELTAVREKPPKSPKSPDYAEIGAVSPRSPHKKMAKRAGGDLYSQHVMEQLNELTNLKHWLTDSQREYSGAIDITDADRIKQALRKQQVSIEQVLIYAKY